MQFIGCVSFTLFYKQNRLVHDKYLWIVFFFFDNIILMRTKKKFMCASQKNNRVKILEKICIASKISSSVLLLFVDLLILSP